MAMVLDRNGKGYGVDIGLLDLKKADAGNMGLATYLNTTLETDEAAYGTPFSQILASEGIVITPNKAFGMRASTIQEIISGSSNSQINLGALNRNDQRDPFSPQGRLLAQATLLEIITSQLQEDNTSYEGTFNKLVAVSSSVDSPRFDQPIINLSAPQSARNQTISQFATPASMVSISVSSASNYIKTRAIGLEMSDEALKNVTIDLVGMSIREQAKAERAVNVDNAIYDLVMGNIDQGTTALTALQSTSFDSNCVIGTKFTHQAFVKFLRSSWRKLNIDWIVCDLSTYLAIEGRDGRPNVMNQPSTDGHLDSMMALANPNIPDSVNYFIVEPDMMHEVGPTSAGYGSSNHPLGGTRKILGIDSTKAIRKVTYAGASYAAIEAYVMSRSTAMRWDYAENYYRNFATGEGFRLMQI